MLNYVLKLSLEPQQVTDRDDELLVEARCTRDEVWDKAAVEAFFAPSNRMVHALGLVANDEFFSLGRTVTGLLTESDDGFNFPWTYASAGCAGALSSSSRLTSPASPSGGERRAPTSPSG